MSNNKIYEMITDRIVKQLEAGHIPWKKPWVDTQQSPKNLISKKPYSGINTFLLDNLDEEWFLTFKQVQSKGGKINKGATGHIVVYWKMLDVEDKAKDGSKLQKRIPLLRYYKVFRLCDTTGIKRPEKTVLQPKASIDEIETFIQGTKADIRIQGDRAFYKPSDDYIAMPDIKQFKDQEHYYAVTFHELGHWTGHKSRLDRGLGATAAFGSESYAKEELVAELTSSYLSADHGIDNIHLQENEAAYIQSWLQALRNDPKMITQAAGKAQKAADYLTKLSA